MRDRPEAPCGVSVGWRVRERCGELQGNLLSSCGNDCASINGTVQKLGNLGISLAAFNVGASTDTQGYNELVNLLVVIMEKQLLSTVPADMHRL